MTTIATPRRFSTTPASFLPAIGQVTGATCDAEWQDGDGRRLIRHGDVGPSDPASFLIRMARETERADRSPRSPIGKVMKRDLREHRRGSVA